MSQIVVKRPPRSLPPEVPADELTLMAPPELPRGQREGLLMQLLPVLGMGSSVVFFFSPQAPPFMRIMGVLMLVSTAGMAIAQLVRHRRGSQGQLADVRRDYLKYLARTRMVVRGTARAQRDAQLYLHPAPEQLWSVVAEGGRVWERRIGDEDFGEVRLGLGRQRLATPLSAPDTAPPDELEPLCAGAMRRFLAVHGSLDGLPVAVSMRASYRVTVCGPAESAQSAARAMVAQLVTLHSPRTWWSRSWRDPVRWRAGSGPSGCRTCRCPVRSTGPARSGCSGTAWVSWSRCWRTGWRGGRGSAARPGRCWTGRTSWWSWTAPRCRRTRGSPRPRGCRA